MSHCFYLLKVGALVVFFLRCVLSTVWNRCIVALEAELAESDLNTWIRPLQVDESGKKIRLFAPNRFVQQWVQQNYGPRLQEILKELGYTEETIEFNIGNIVPAKSKTSESSRLHQDSVNKPISEQRFTSKNSNTQRVTPQQPRLLSPEDDVIPPLLRTGLNPTFSFFNFVEGKSNQFGRAAAVQIADKPGTDYNPMLIYGATGLGKTHLVHAVGNAILTKKPDARVFYVTAEQYFQEMVRGVQRGQLDEFKTFYRSLDALLIDDIQFFAKKERTQDEFFHLFNAMFEQKQQIVITCDRYPQEVKGLEDRLKSRFGWGLTVNIEPPELETRIAILNAKAEESGVILPNDVAHLIARHIRSNVRQLEGALRRIVANARFTQSRITFDFAREALRDIIAKSDRQNTVENIQQAVSEYYAIKISDLTGSRRTRTLARPRQIAMALSKELTSLSLPEIGRKFGGRDHTTVLHACRKVESLRQSDAHIDEDYTNLIRVLSS